MGRRTAEHIGAGVDEVVPHGAADAREPGIWVTLQKLPRYAEAPVAALK